MDKGNNAVMMLEKDFPHWLARKCHVKTKYNAADVATQPFRTFLVKGRFKRSSKKMRRIATD
jgi:hypothetical protein